MLLRATVWRIVDGVPVQRMILDLVAVDAADFMGKARAPIRPGDVHEVGDSTRWSHDQHAALEFGPIGEPWSVQHATDERVKRLH